MEPVDAIGGRATQQRQRAAGQGSQAQARFGVCANAGRGLVKGEYASGHTRAQTPRRGPRPSLCRTCSRVPCPARAAAPRRANAPHHHHCIRARRAHMPLHAVVIITPLLFPQQRASEAPGHRGGGASAHGRVQTRLHARTPVPRGKRACVDADHHACHAAGKSGVVCSVGA